MVYKTMLVLALSTICFAAASGPQNVVTRQRLRPIEIEALAATGGGTGTSGVSGIQTRVLKGDPARSGPYTIQLTVPANTKIQAHVHPDDWVGIVVSGTWYFGYGSRFDEKQLKALPPGSFYTEPPDDSHFARTGNTPVVLLISGFGPSGTRYTDQWESLSRANMNLEQRDSVTHDHESLIGRAGGTDHVALREGTTDQMTIKVNYDRDLHSGRSFSSELTYCDGWFAGEGF